MIGLTENPVMLDADRDWPGNQPRREGVNDNEDNEELPHHEEGHASQHRFQRHVKDLTEVLLSKGSPFEEESNDLVTLNNKVFESSAAAESVHKSESMGQEFQGQYKNFRESVLDSNVTLLTAPIKRNNSLLFHEEKSKKKTDTKLRMQHFKRHAELYGQAFVVLDSHGG
ncbi:hypothetical protein BSL78_04618 [Apostichopus japonicus]|uniref:Uncharacterized protein n=1 Tax=Stichopus japonicus TaxID=307972 RepID=A0A2G8LE51_STIJA|nr:hypothetical protein BSL78_04618 [Apostichopus japonicus]